MGVTNLGRVQGGGFYYADYTPSDADSSIRLGRVWLKPNTVKALIGDHVVMADGSLWEISAFSSDAELDLLMTLERKTSIRGKIGETGAQGEAGIGCSINGVPTALDFASDPQIQLDELKQQNASQSSQIENLGQTDQNMQSQIDVLKKLYAVGSIYMSTNSTSPASLFGGTWERIKDKFLLGSGDSYSAGATGGSATHTHNASGFAKISTSAAGINVSQKDQTIDWAINYRMATPSNASQQTGMTSWGVDTDTTVHSSTNMPPYLAVYIWKRTA